MSRKDKQRARGKRYYIATALDYPDGPPHMGHSLEKGAADVIPRRLDTHRQMGQLLVDFCSSWATPTSHSSIQLE
jgi:methionyl-tRNA synthetase